MTFEQITEISEKRGKSFAMSPFFRRGIPEATDKN